jgi:outer membrane autotransporter protein
MNRTFKVVWNASQGLWAVASEVVPGAGKSAAAVVGAALLAFSAAAFADCTIGAGSASCSPGTTQTATVGSGAGTPAGFSIDVQPNAQISAGDATALSMGDNATIRIEQGATVQNAGVNGNGNYGTGANTIEFHSGNTLTIAQGAKVLSTGSAGTAEAINPIGSGNLIVNNGEVRSQAGGAAIWFESSSGSNTVVNGATGTIEYKGGAGDIMGVSGTMAIDFTNQGRLIGALNFAAGADTLRLYTGSSISGAINGGGGSNLLTLNGTGTDTFAQPISNFQTLVKNDAGTWTFSESLAASGITSTRVAGGTLVLGSDASGYTGGMTVDAAGTLQTSAGFAPAAITDNGLVRFAQPVDGSYGGLVSGSGGIEKTGAGTLTLTRQPAVTGTTTVGAGTLKAGAADIFSASSAHVVAAGAMLDTGGFSQVLASLDNAGSVKLLSGAAGSTLTVTGAYVGRNGVLNLGTVLGDSQSASDRLVLSGPSASASGKTTINITNLGGLGALTAGNGIEVVSALNGATTTAQSTRDAFTLANGHVDAGAYEYHLYAADAQGAGENWYLRSSAPVAVGVKSATGDTHNAPDTTGTPAASAPVTLQAPGDPVLPAASLPLYRAEVPLFAALPAQLRQADLAMLGNLHRRIGDADAPGADAPSGNGRQAWARAVHADLDIRQGGAAQAQSRGHVSGVQAGTDLLASGNWRAGVYVGQLDGGADVNGNAHGFVGRVGSNDLQSRYLGAYATWMDASGWYADGVLQAGSHRYTARPDGSLTAAGKARSLTASIEAGKSFPIAEQWRIEPQMQLIYQRSRFDDVPISGAIVRERPDGGVIGRLGVRIKGDLATAAGRLQPYARINLYRASAGTDVAEFVGPAASTRIGSASGYTAAEVAGGMTLALSATTSLYGEVGRLFDVGGEARVKSSVEGSLGLRVRW